MEFKFVLSRHAQSTHNIHKNEARSSNSLQEKNYKDTATYKKIKYDPSLLDLKDIDEDQILQNKKMYDFQSINLIITSPLNRCLQTTKKLVQDYKHIQVIVQPCLTSRISSAWSVGKPLKQKIKEYPNFNFDFAQKQQTNWCFDILDQHTKSKYNKKDHSPESILEFIQEGHPEPYQNIMNRIRKLKNKIKNIYLQRSGKKRILILSHSCILKTILASEINKKGKATSHTQFYHCMPLYITQDYLLNETILHADLNEQKNFQKQQNKNIIHKKNHE